MKSHQFTLTKDGDGIRYDREPAAVLSTLRNGRYTVTIERAKDPRSVSQNALMWMWFECIARELESVSKEYVHDVYSAKFLTRVVEWEGDEITIVPRTKYLTKDEMTEFLNNVHADAAEMGITLPLPEDRYFEDFYNTYK